MNTTAKAPERIRDFVTAVAGHFDDLPEADRAELLEDLEQHLVEVAAEDDDGLDLELVDPAAYAAELRNSAGLPARDPASRPPGRLTRLGTRIRGRFERLRQQPAAREVVEFLPELRPAWWVVRAWVAVTAVAMTFGGGHWSRHAPVPGRDLLGLLVLGLAIAVSVRLGRARLDRTRVGRVADLAAGFVAILIGVHALTAGPELLYVTEEVPIAEWQPPVLRHPDGEPITNLYLFDEDGDPLEDVYVFDGIGRPVEIGDLDAAGFEHIETDFPRARSGERVHHRYPLEQFTLVPRPDGSAVRRPRPTPTVSVPGDPSPRGAQRPSPGPGTTAAPSPSATPEPTPPRAADSPDGEPSPTAGGAG